jgi:ABC-2 type transport system ATP-binding protein
MSAAVAAPSVDGRVWHRGSASMSSDARPLPHTAPLIDVRRVGKRAASTPPAEDVWALADVDVSIDAGDTLGVLGRNGSGKTTLLAIVAGSLGADAGEVLIGGVDVRTDPAARRRITLVADDGQSLASMRSVREHLDDAARRLGFEGRRASAPVDRAIAGMHLEPIMERRVASVDRGARRRIAIAVAMIAGTEALLVDEPTRGLDPASTHDVVDRLRAIAHDDEHTLVLATHDVAIVQALCRRVLVIDGGRVIAEGGTRSLLSPSAESAYRVVVSSVSASLAPRLEVAFSALTIERARHHATITAPLDHPDDLYDLIHVLETEGAVIEAIDRVDLTIDDVVRHLLTPPATFARMRGWRKA